MDLLGGSLLSNEPSQVVNAAGFGEARFVDGVWKSIFERHHQLDALGEVRPSSSSVVVPLTSRPRANRVMRASSVSSPADTDGFVPETIQSRIALRRSFRVPSMQGQVAIGPYRHASDPLVVGQNGVRLTHDVVRVCTRLEHERRVNTFFGAIGHADDGGIANTWDLVERALDVLGEDVQSLGRHNHFLLAPFDEQSTVAVALADVAGMQPPFGVDRRISGDRFGVRCVITTRDVFPRERGSRRRPQSVLRRRRLALRLNPPSGS